jgi:hypothetical protein
LIEQPYNPFIYLPNIVAATEASMQFSAVLSMGGSAIASGSQPIPCSDTNSNFDDITDMTGVENPGLVNGSTIIEGTMSLGG